MKNAFQQDTSVGSQESICNTKISGVMQVQISIAQKRRSFGLNSLKQTGTKWSLHSPYELQHACWHLRWHLGEASFRYLGWHLSKASTPLRTTAKEGSFNRKLAVDLLMLLCKTSGEAGAWGCSWRSFRKAHKHGCGSWVFLFQPVAFPLVSWFVARAQHGTSLLSLWQNEVLSDRVAVLVLQFPHHVAVWLKHWQVLSTSLSVVTRVKRWGALQKVPTIDRHEVPITEFRLKCCTCAKLILNLFKHQTPCLCQSSYKGL